MTSNLDQPAQSFASIGIDIGKDVFHIVGFDLQGKVILRKKFKRLALETELAKLPPSIVGLEACLSAHFVSRTLRRFGHTPRIIPAMYVKPFIKGQKNDYNDAEAIAEAALRPNLRIVQEKTQDQLDLQALHRVRAHAGVAANGHNQSDSSLPHRARHCHAHGSTCTAPVSVSDSGTSSTRTVSAYDGPDRRTL